MSRVLPSVTLTGAAVGREVRGSRRSVKEGTQQIKELGDLSGGIL